jgi:hypothetical protein
MNVFASWRRERELRIDEFHLDPISGIFVEQDEEIKWVSAAMIEELRRGLENHVSEHAETLRGSRWGRRCPRTTSSACVRRRMAADLCTCNWPSHPVVTKYCTFKYRKVRNTRGLSGIRTSKAKRVTTEKGLDVTVTRG